VQDGIYPCLPAKPTIRCIKLVTQLGDKHAIKSGLAGTV
jgi:hypothetical protein